MSSDSARPLFEPSDDDRLVTVMSGPFEPPTSARGRTRLRQAVLLALMALAGSLIFVLPEPDQEGYALSSDEETTIRIGQTDAATRVQRLSGAEGNTGDELALATGSGQSRDVVGGVGTSAVDLGSESGNPDDSAGHSLAAGIAEMAALAKVPSAPVVTETTSLPTTTAAPEDIAVETTATTTVETTTSMPTTTATAADESAANAEPNGSTADGSSDGEGDAAAPDGGDAAGANGTTPDAGEGDQTTTEPQPPADTQPPETQPPDTQPPDTQPEPNPVDPAWVDAGNGVLVPPVLVAIRYCESRDDYAAANPRSTARGAFQFLTGSWDYYGHKARYGVNQAHLATPAQQDEAALMTWERDGTRPWNASKSCWSQRI